MTPFISYRSRSSLATSAVAKKMFLLMEEKGSNLCLGIDRVDSDEILKLAETIGPEICLLKTHVDIINDFSFDFIRALKRIAERHKFLIFEDRKFADIGNTTKLQYTSGVHKIVEWADIVNAHPLPGTGIVEALKKGAKEKERGLVLIAQMSSHDNLITEHYSQAAVQMAKNNNEWVCGYICQERIDDSPGAIHMIPGVCFNKKRDSLGQRYTEPATAISKGGDLIIVGRGITDAKNPLEEARRYRQEAWQAYQKRLEHNLCLN